MQKCSAPQGNITTNSLEVGYQEVDGRSIESEQGWRRFTQDGSLLPKVHPCLQSERHLGTTKSCLSQGDSLEKDTLLDFESPLRTLLAVPSRWIGSPSKSVQCLEALCPLHPCAALQANNSCKLPSTEDKTPSPQSGDARPPPELARLHCGATQVFQTHYPGGPLPGQSLTPKAPHWELQEVENSPQDYKSDQVQTTSLETEGLIHSTLEQAPPLKWTQWEPEEDWEGEGLVLEKVIYEPEDHMEGGKEQEGKGFPILQGDTFNKADARSLGKSTIFIARFNSQGFQI